MLPDERAHVARPSGALAYVGFASGLLLNGVVLAQVLYYGVVGEGRSVLGVLASDFVKDGGAV